MRQHLLDVASGMVEEGTILSRGQLPVASGLIDLFISSIKVVKELLIHEELSLTLTRMIQFGPLDKLADLEVKPYKSGRSLRAQSLNRLGKLSQVFHKLLSGRFSFGDCFVNVVF